MSWKKANAYLNSAKYQEIVKDIETLKIFSSNVDIFIFAAGIGFSNNICEPIEKGQNGTEIKTSSTDALKNNLQYIQAIALAKKQDVTILDDWDECVVICSEFVNGGLSMLEDLRNEYPQDSTYIDQLVQLMRRQAIKNIKNKK
mgnify:CR=1 FL=1